MERRQKKFPKGPVPSVHIQWGGRLDTHRDSQPLGTPAITKEKKRNMATILIDETMATERTYEGRWLTVGDHHGVRDGPGISIGVYAEKGTPENGVRIVLTAEEAQWLAEQIEPALRRSVQAEEYEAEWRSPQPS
jgi:hypothetical protein